jgi:beta-glucosidase/6-phospho-beta-glucosidase/beta-galactosidase
MSLLKSFFVGGFECSTHYGPHRRRLDLLATTQHDRFAVLDYARLQNYGIFTVREGVRWYRIERIPGHYRFCDTLSFIHTAQDMGMQVIWDLLHFGYPDDIDPLRSDFVKRFAAFARAFIHVLKNETESIPLLTPINEISFLAFQGGQIGHINPFTIGRGHALKAQLVRATIEAMEAIWDVAPEARFVTTEPLFNTVAENDAVQQTARAEDYSNARYEACDMLAGILYPQLGGAPKYLDILGVDYDPWNRWIYASDTEADAYLAREDLRYPPLHHLLAQIHERYKRPLLITETSAEGDARPSWLAYVSDHVQRALQSGIPVEALCWYPIVDFPGGDNDRPSHTGLWGMCDENGARSLYEPLARELTRQAALIQDVQIARNNSR